MSEVRRYEFDENGVCYHKEDGPFVSFDDYARLKSENERLRKAGDAVILEWSMGEENGAKNYLNALVNWNAAKDGKPTE